MDNKILKYLSIGNMRERERESTTNPLSSQQKNQLFKEGETQQNVSSFIVLNSNEDWRDCCNLIINNLIECVCVCVCVQHIRAFHAHMVFSLKEKGKNIKRSSHLLYEGGASII